uniref:Uncharacterized protein n=1 Tax=Ciona savignyi TaxID=51511 RepID=H2YZM6_CIOSA
MVYLFNGICSRINCLVALHTATNIL